MKKFGIKYQLHVLTFLPVLFVAGLFAVFYHHQYTQDLARHLAHLQLTYKRQLLPATELAIQKKDPRLLKKFLSPHFTNQTSLLARYQMYIALLLITLIGLVISFSIHYILSQQIYRPLARLRRSMLQILNNEFETQIKTLSHGELGIIERGCAHLQQQYLNIIQDLNQHIEVATSDLQQSLELLEEKNIQLSLEKKKIEEKIKQKSEFIANMSHEIRTPMNGVIGFTNVLLESKLDPLQLDYVKTIKSSAQDLLATINDILDYSKIDAGKLILESIPFNIRACIDEVSALVTPNAHAKGIDLIPITATTIPKTLLGDPWRFKQILSNLLSNAVKFTEQGHVLIRTHVYEESDTHYTLSLMVSDTGIGIAAEDQTQLFNAFNQANVSMTRRFGGSGLGLIICKKLVEHMQGRITIESELHKGTTFTAYIKLAKLASYEIEKHHSSPYVNLTAICYDENPLYLEALCNGLNYWGITCHPVPHSNQLEDAYTQYPQTHMAFVSVNKDSMQFTSNIAFQHSNIPTIFVSKSYLHNYTELGGHALLLKPLGIQKIQETVELIASPVNTQSNSQASTTSYDEISSQAIDLELEALRQRLRTIYPSILVAEDNLINRMLLCSILGHNAQMFGVENGMETVTICNEHRFAVILLDLHMPKLNGIEAAKIIRTESLYNKSTPIVLITANAGDVSAAELIDANIKLCLQKPIDEKMLLQHLLNSIKQPSGAINWALCLQRVSGNKELAYEFLTGFVEELAEHRAEFLTLSTAEDYSGLEQRAHKLHGACCFCGVPLLQKIVASVEQSAKNHLPWPLLRIKIQELIKTIDEVIHEYPHVRGIYSTMEAKV